MITRGLGGQGRPLGMIKEASLAKIGRQFQAAGMVSAKVPGQIFLGVFVALEL